MPTVVVDASAVAALLFAEVRSDEMARAIAGCALQAPRLIRSELLSVARKKVLFDPTLHIAVTAGLGRYFGLRVVESDPPLQPVLELALETQLSTYDASYLWLAQANNLRLITLDAALARAAAG